MSEPKDCPMCGDDPARVAMCQECNGTGHAKTSPMSKLAERIAEAVARRARNIVQIADAKSQGYSYAGLHRDRDDAIKELDRLLFDNSHVICSALEAHATLAAKDAEIARLRAGLGGTRSNRNVEVESKLRAALSATERSKP